MVQLKGIVRGSNKRWQKHHKNILAIICWKAIETHPLRKILAMPLQICQQRACDNLEHSFSRKTNLQLCKQVLLFGISLNKQLMFYTCYTCLLCAAKLHSELIAPRIIITWTHQTNKSETVLALWHAFIHWVKPLHYVILSLIVSAAK